MRAVYRQPSFCTIEVHWDRPPAPEMLRDYRPAKAVNTHRSTSTSTSISVGLAPTTQADMDPVDPLKTGSP